MSQPDTTKRTVAADAGHMKNTVPAGKPYATAKTDTCGQKAEAAAGGSVAVTTQDKPREIKHLPRTPWTPMTPAEQKEALRICKELCEELATIPELTSDEEPEEGAMAEWFENWSHRPDSV